jgi:hypothetical protein
MNDQDKIQRTVLLIPDRPRTRLITYDAKDLPRSSDRVIVSFSV